MSKLAMVVAGAAGYVLGARAGRGQYDKIRDQAQRVWSDPRVQEKKDQVQDVAQRKGAEVSEKVQEKVQEKIGSGGDSAADGPSTDRHGAFPSNGGVGA